MRDVIRTWFRPLVAGLGLSLPLLTSVSFGQAGSVHEYKTDDLSFSMMLPADWEVSQDTAGFDLFAEPKEKKLPTAENPVVADPNITVSASRNPMPIDEQALEKYSGQIFAGLQKVVGENAGLEIFLKKVVDVNDSRKGLLYYVRYKKGKFDVFNAIMVVSSETHVFRVTLTDYGVSFDANLDKYFPFMSSINIGASQIVRPSLLEVAIPWIAGCLGLIIVLFVSRMVMHSLAQGRLSEALSESVSEQAYSSYPQSKPVDFKGSVVDFKGTEVKSDYDPEFRESSEMSRFHGEGDMTEVPLSQAMGSQSRVSDSMIRRSVSDPESEYGDPSAVPSAAGAQHSKHQRSQAKSAPAQKAKAPARQSEHGSEGSAYSPGTSFGFTRAPEDDDV
jgi:hypothetical protein